MKREPSEETKFLDKGFDTILNCLRDCSDYTNFSDEADICDDIETWIIKNCKHLNIETISTIMEDKMYTNLLCFLRDFQDYTDFEEEVDACYQIEQRLEYSKHSRSFNQV